MKTFLNEWLMTNEFVIVEESVERSAMSLKPIRFMLSSSVSN